jgi:mono/diheme cytochrome c family protein
MKRDQAPQRFACTAHHTPSRKKMKLALTLCTTNVWRCLLFGTTLWLAALAAGCAAGRHQTSAANAELGGTHFETYCAGCHVEDTGIRGQTPPLEGSSWVTGPEGRLIKIVLHGVRGEMVIQGRTYDQEMPGFGPVLSDSEIASLLSFVRRQFGGINTPIALATVSAIRAAHSQRTTYWTVEELLRDP